jgi:hypothetical protein
MTNSGIKKHLQSICLEVERALINPHLKKIFENRSFLAGGAIRALKMNKPVNDYDFFFSDKETAQEFLSTIESGLKQTTTPFAKQETLKLNKIHKSDNAITFTLKSVDENAEIVEETQREYKIQFITKYYGNPMEVVNRFDFHHCMGYYIYQVDELYTTPLMEKAIKAKQLVYNPSSQENGLEGLPRRFVKFVEMGFVPTESCVISVAEAIGKQSFSQIDEMISRADRGGGDY